MATLYEKHYKHCVWYALFAKYKLPIAMYFL